MRRRLRSILLAAACCVIGVGDASASPITWTSSGVISFISPAPGSAPPVPAFISLGLPWTLTFTFDPNAPGTPLCANSSTFGYSGAITDTHLQLGGFIYSHTPADIFTNFFLPIGTCGEGGIVNFFWGSVGWIPGPGAPALPAFLIAAYDDDQACDGSLPATPNLPAPPCVNNPSSFLSSMLVQVGPAGGQFGSAFTPSVVPEPATCVLVGTGLAGIAWRRRRQARRRP